MNFLNYIYPVKPQFFEGKIGLDAGCGFGRHLFYAAEFGAEMIGVDLSEAVEAAYRNTKHLPNVHIIQADIYNLSFRDNSFDFIYSIGVLHHLPDPKEGFKSLLPLLKSGGAIFIWVYSTARPGLNYLIELIRKVTTKIPYKPLKYLCFLAASLEWILLIKPYKILSTKSISKNLINHIAPSRIKLYAQYPFQVSYADWFDRLSAPIRFYYSEDDIRQWFEEANLRNIIVSPTGAYGWRGFGEAC